MRGTCRQGKREIQEVQVPRYTLMTVPKRPGFRSDVAVAEDGGTGGATVESTRMVIAPQTSSSGMNLVLVVAEYF